MNIDQLKVKIKRKGYTIRDFADKIGISKETMYRRFAQSGSDFTISEIEKMILALDMTQEDACKIFLS